MRRVDHINFLDLVGVLHLEKFQYNVLKDGIMTEKDIAIANSARVRAPISTIQEFY